MIALSFPRKQVSAKNFQQNFFGRKFLWLQNHFLISAKTGSFQKFSSKLFWSRIFFDCKIISSKTGPTKNVQQNFLVEHILWLQNRFLENRFLQKNFMKHFLVENFFWLQNHFFANRLLPKIYIKTFYQNVLWL